jgi:acyl-coenzyme A synthetase/AMP-(fatty) acid ligase
VHLRALAQSGISFPKVSRILCATAPLSAELAANIETLLEGELIEVFGCSEVGSMARRRSSKEEQWHLFPGLNIAQEQDDFVLRAEHLPSSVRLQDRFTFSDPSTFTLGGRDEDLIEVAGKRGSLLELNTILLACEEVKDGVVFLPKDDQGVNRPAAIIAADSAHRSRIQNAFHARVDPVFVPRPMIFVDALPREENGKLKQHSVQALFKSLVNA